MTFFDLLKESRIHLRRQGSWRFGQSNDGASTVVTSDLGPSPPVSQYGPEMEMINERLAAGAPLAELRNVMCAAKGSTRAAALLLLLQRLCEQGFIEFPLAGEQVVILPQWASFTPALAPQAPPAGTGLDRFAFMRRDEGTWLLESPLAGARFRFTDFSSLDAPLTRRALAAAGFLETHSPEGNPRRDALAQWEFHDLAFHTHNRMGWHRDPLGRLFPFIDEIKPLPAVRPPWPGKRLALARAPDEPGREPFAEVLARRRSERAYDEAHPISVRDLGALLDCAARIHAYETVPAVNSSGASTEIEVAHRPYPNGGASYELEIYPVVDRCDGLDPGLYHYDAATHELVRLSGRTPEVDRIFADAKAATANLADPQVVLILSARFARVMWKYRSISYGIILRNTGVLYQTLYLAATELGLSPCGIGSANSALFARATGLDPVVEGSVGDFILGGRPRS